MRVRCCGGRAGILVAGVVLLVAGCGLADAAVPVRTFEQLPTAAMCEQVTGERCYAPTRLSQAYGIDRLHRRGVTGKGTTIVVYDWSGADTFREDLRTFSRGLGLPEPRLEIRDVPLDYGAVREYDNTDPAMVRAALETTLNLQLVHAVAPEARIVLEQVGLPDDDRTSQLTSGELVDLLAIRLRSTIDHDPPDVISLGNGLQEAAVARADPGAAKQRLRNLHAIFQDAARQRVTVVAGTGGPDRQGSAVSWPATDPAVLAVGGTTMRLPADAGGGSDRAPARAWRPPAGQAAGGGRSGIFERPRYQRHLGQAVGNHRAVPDISMFAAPDGTLVYQSLTGRTGWVTVGGTEIASALFAGVVALAAHLGGRGLGGINDDLYALGLPAAIGGAAPRTGVLDVTQGGDPEVGGRQAGEGYDLASGLGTIDAEALVPHLARSATGPEQLLPGHLGGQEADPDRTGCVASRGRALELTSGPDVWLEAWTCLRVPEQSDRLRAEVAITWQPMGEGQKPGEPGEPGAGAPAPEETDGRLEDFRVELELHRQGEIAHRTRCDLAPGFDEAQGAATCWLELKRPTAHTWIVDADLTWVEDGGDGKHEIDLRPTGPWWP